MTVAQLIFYIFAALAVGGGLGVVLMRNAVYAAIFLILSLLAVAGIYILLASEFLALVQILVYGGAVTVIFLFALMLTNSEGSRTWPVGLQLMVGEFQLPWGLVAAGGLISIVPILLFFVFAQRALVRGLLVGAVKG